MLVCIASGLLGEGEVYILLHQNLNSLADNTVSYTGKQCVSEDRVKEEIGSSGSDDTFIS